MTQRSKDVSHGEKRKPPNAGIGRKKGVVNKTTKALKDMILEALDNCGGAAYLTERANDPKTASAFLTLLGKVLPMAITGPDGGAVQQEWVLTLRRPDDASA